MVVGQGTEVRKHSKRFYLSLVVILIVGFTLFSIFVNMFSKTSKTVTIPIAFPIVTIFIFYETIIRARGLDALGLKKENFLRNIGIGVLTAFLGFYLIFLIIELTIPGVMEEIKSRPETISNFFMYSFSFPLNYILQTIYVFGMLSPAEELLFRGFIQNKLQKIMSPHLAVIVQSTLFGLAHLIPAYASGWPLLHCLIYGLIGFIGGIILGVIFYETDNNIVAPWIAHAIADAPLTLLLLI